MINLKINILLLSFMLIFFKLVNSSEIKSSNAENFKRLIKTKYEVDLGKIVEDNLHHIRNHLDPYEPLILEDVTINRNGYLQHGLLYKLSMIQHSGESTLVYDNKELCFNLNMGWFGIRYNYQYLYRILLHIRTGTLFGTVDKLKINFTVCADLKNYKFIFKTFKFTEVGFFNIQLGGGSGNHILEIIGKWLLNRNKEDIMKSIEKEAVELFKKMIDDWNSHIPQAKRQIEFLNLVNERILRYF